MGKILLEFFSTCPGWAGDERLVVAIANSPEWRDRVDLRLYHLYKDPTPGVRYQPITGSTVVIDGRTRLAGTGFRSITQALETAARERVNHE